MRIWPRLVAMVALSVPFTRWMTARQEAKLAHFGTLSRDALLAALQKEHTHSGVLSYVASFLALALCFFAVHGVAVLIEKVTGTSRVERHD
jgi:hypothetical protein